MSRCEASTRAGAPCRAHAVTGGTRCFAHAGRRLLVEDELVATIAAAAREEWRAAAWLLRWLQATASAEEPVAAGALDELSAKRDARRAAAR